ncbi:MAG: hypothetical protein WDW38_011400 [Sanguina aurantia]
MQLLVNLDMDNADPGINHGAAILMRSSWLQPYYRTGYDVQLPVVKAAMQLPHTLMPRLAMRHFPTPAPPQGQRGRNSTTRACHHLANSDGDMCQSLSFALGHGNASQGAAQLSHRLASYNNYELPADNEPPAIGSARSNDSGHIDRSASKRTHLLAASETPHTTSKRLTSPQHSHRSQLSKSDSSSRLSIPAREPKHSKPMDLVMDEVIASRPMVGPHRNASLLLYFKGSLYRASPGYERRTAPLGELIASLGGTVNTFTSSTKHAIVVDGLCFGAWPAAGTTKPDEAGQLRAAPHCAGCTSHSKPGPGNTSVPCDIAPELPTYEEGMAAARFVLAPWGVGAQTYRTLEAITAGSVPVLISDEPVVPYDGEGRLGRLWGACVVRTHVANLTTLPATLQGMTEVQYRGHLGACLSLLQEREVFMGAGILHGLCAVASRLAGQMKRGAEWFGTAAQWCEMLPAHS